MWRALAPLVQQIEALGQVLEFCAAYYSWCAGCAAGLALLLLAGLAVQEARDAASEDGCPEGTNGTRENGASEPHRACGAEHFEWGLSG